MLLPSTNDSHHLAKAQKSHDEINTYSHLIKHLTTDKDARKLTILLVINLLCAVLEVIYGLLSNSIGLLSDSAHMLFDSTALAVGIYASYKATLPANSKFSYGFDRFQTLSGLINGIFLIFIGFYIFIESLERMYNPPVIHCSKMIVVAIVGLIVNVVGVTFFHEHAHFGEDHGHAHGSGCSHSHGKKEKKAVKNHSHSHKEHAKAVAGHSHSHNHDHADNNVSSIHHVESSNSVPSTLNSIKEDDQSHSHSHTHDHSNCNHGHNSQQPDHHTQHHCSHDEKSQAHTHAHTHIHEHKHEHAHHEHEEHDHKHEDEHEHDHGHDHHHNENLYGVFLHILADLLGSVGVITSSILIMLFDWYVADAICSAITSLLILASVVPLIKSSIMVFLQTYPAKYKKSFHHALSEISNHPSVIEFKDAHLWAYTQSRLVCSVVLVVKQNTTDTNSIVEYARKKLKTIKNIEYMTIDCRAEGQI